MSGILPSLSERTTYHGASILLDFYAPVRRTIVEMLDRPFEESGIWNWDAFLKRQPVVVQGTLRKLSKNAAIISAREVFDAICELALPELEDALADRGMKVAFVASSPNSSSALSLLLLIHGIKRNKGIVDAIKGGRVVINLDSKPDSDADVVFIVEDAVYSGGAVAAQLQNMRSHKSQLIQVLLPMTTAEAVETVDRVCMKNAVISVGRNIPTVFSGMTMEEVLLMDVFWNDGENVRSYMFDVLKLDDRHSLHLLQHKVNDVSMAPHTLLHVGPCFPKVDHAYRVSTLHAATEILMQINYSENGAKHARVADYVCKHFDLLRDLLRDVHVSHNQECTNLPVLNPSFYATDYHKHLSLFS